MDHSGRTTAAAGGSAVSFQAGKEAARPCCWFWGIGVRSDQPACSMAQPPPSKPGSARAWCAFWPLAARNHQNRATWRP